MTNPDVEAERWRLLQTAGLDVSPVDTHAGCAEAAASGRLSDKEMKKRDGGAGRGGEDVEDRPPPPAGVES